MLILLAGLAVSLPPARAASFTLVEPSADRWVYPHVSGATGANYASMPVFGAVGEAAADDRMAQVFLRFDTTSVVAAGLGAANYQATAFTLSLMLTRSGAIYDPTTDAYASYLSGGTDLDAGRPVELFGVGYRNGYTAQTWQATSDFGGTGESQRNAYAAGFDGSGNLIDVSNNVSEAFEATPWAVGQVAGSTPGTALADGAVMTFTFDLSNPYTLAYLQESLDRGFVDLMVTSLHPASQPGTGGAQVSYPAFAAMENIEGYEAARLSGTIAVVPEPQVAWLAALGLGLSLVIRRGARHA
jgi:hypothetical protein